MAASQVLPAVVDLLKPNGQLLTLIKPQFEASSAQVRGKCCSVVVGFLACSDECVCESDQDLWILELLPSASLMRQHSPALDMETPGHVIGTFRRCLVHLRANQASPTH